MLKRQSVRRARYDWFERYCGLPEDSTRLFNAVLNDLRYDAFLDLVKDEFAPVGIVDVHVSVHVCITLCVCA